MSDFSIDYILNRAGDKYNGTNGSLGILRRIRFNRLFHPYMIDNNLDNLKSQISRQQNVGLDEVQNRGQQLQESLDWLQYSRYHPPKLPRKFVEILFQL